MTQKIVFLRQRHNMAKLDEHDVYLIKGLIYHGMTHKEIAEKFEVTTGCISRISCGQVWKHVPDYVEETQSNHDSISRNAARSVAKSEVISKGKYQITRIDWTNA